MEAYPTDYVEHNLPLVYLSGLGTRSDDGKLGLALPGQESGTRVAAISEECTNERGKQLFAELLKQDGTQRGWNSDALPGPNGALKYRMKAIRRAFTLPPRKAAPLPQSPSEGGMPKQMRSTELHSPLSPLSPGSPLYPDGVMTPLWFAKHQHLVPSLLIAFFQISAEGDTPKNEQIHSDINSIRTALARSGYKTRFAAVLMSDKSILHAPELEDRIAAVRRATGLDPKNGLFFMPPMSSQAEIATFVQTMLSTLQPVMVEHYRDLTKHARRKKARGGPAASGTLSAAHSLSTPGWNVRYEVKQGVFAEFRQEMDVAERHYSTAIEELFSSEGALETTSSWSPRWNEARLLCDIVALRVLRCQLWTGQTTGATVSWVNYKARSKDLVDRRGKGSETYGWFAWESRWAEVMAQLIQRAVLPSLQPPDQGGAASAELTSVQFYAPIEKSLATERIAPFDLLHHPGYWLRLAFQSAVARREKALAIPEEDRISPGQSPASAVAHRSKNYDAYLAPDPHEEFALPFDGGHKHHLAILRQLAEGAREEFKTRGQIRSFEKITFDLARQLASAGHYDVALELLLPLWRETTWRSDDWEELLHPFLSTVHECALRTQNGEVSLQTAWELLSLRRREGELGDKPLADYVSESFSEKIATKMERGERRSPLDVAFAFGDQETHVGDQVECQLSLRSNATHGTAPLQLTQVEIALNDDRSIVLKHDPSGVSDADAATPLTDLTGRGSTDQKVSLEADLTLVPSKQRVYSFSLGFREANMISVASIKTLLDNEAFSLEQVFSNEQLSKATSIWLKHEEAFRQRTLPWSNTLALTVLPKPPRLQMLLHGLHSRYYTNEDIQLSLELVNAEAEAINATATVRPVGKTASALPVRWDQQDALESEISIGALAQDAVHTVDLQITAASEPVSQSFEIEIRYFLDSEPDTPLVKVLVTELNILKPFEAKYNFGSLLHPDPWPSYFSTNVESQGIPQQWRLGTTLHSVAEDTLEICSMEAVLDRMSEGGSCDLAKSSFETQQKLQHSRDLTCDFSFVTRKSSLDDRRPAEVELSLDIKWRRETNGAEVTTRLPVPRLQLPSSEPRVLCTVEDVSSNEDEVLLHYHLENPSTHFLTFALTMEASDDFAFSGPKYRALSLAPLSRLRVEYRLLLHDNKEGGSKDDAATGRWIWPVLQVVDSYYQKTLRVHSGGPRVRVDDKRGLAVQAKVQQE